MTTNFFSPLSFVAFLDPGSGMAKNQDPGSGIKIPDPQHWQQEKQKQEEQQEQQANQEHQEQ